jgi:hypothetical protein
VPTRICNPNAHMTQMPNSANLAYAVRLVHATCSLAGSSSFLDDVRAELRGRGVIRAVKTHDTPALFDWLIEALSYQGISDAIASGYMAQHGTVRWEDIAEALARRPSCPKLGGYWRFYDCQYQKGSGTCAEPIHIDGCPLPRHPLRNGHLNQLAYSLFLFIRDIANRDLVSWIDQQLSGVYAGGLNRPVRLREAIVGPLRNVYGVADKVLAMTLSALLMGAGNGRPLWFDVGADLVAVDTLVHNFLHRTGILQRLSAEHPYGAACYRAGGCASIIRSIARQIDAAEFNSGFPPVFPRFVQIAIWAYCAQNGLGVCNGNRIDDARRCENVHCQLFSSCDRVALRQQSANNRAKSVA